MANATLYSIYCVGAHSCRLCVHPITPETAQVLTPEHSSTHLWASLVYETFDEALEAASEMNGQELDGRLLRVSIVDPPAEDGGDSPATTKQNS